MADLVLDKSDKRVCLGCSKFHSSLPIKLPCGNVTCPECLNQMFIYDRTMIACKICSNQTHFIENDSSLVEDTSYESVINPEKYLPELYEEAKQKLDELISLNRKPFLFIDNHFLDLKARIDLSAESMISRINKIRLDLIDKCNESEKMLIENFENKIFDDYDLEKENFFESNLAKIKDSLKGAHTSGEAVDQLKRELDDSIESICKELEKYTYRLFKNKSYEFVEGKALKPDSESEDNQVTTSYQTSHKIRDEDLLGKFEIIENVKSDSERDLIR